ncbi:MAG: class I mannose-6-phosphate isomerase [Bacteroidales bacterium]|nr:class I mannose-6-phosphate isomerase [Bacteroidales bacterium]
MEKKLYPFKFVPVASRRPWGGSALVKELGKNFVECDEEGNETVLGDDVLIGESWELADMGIEDSVVANGWLAGNTISELMETYLERIVGEDVYNHYGRQFPLLIKFLDINDKLSVQVHPDDEVAAERYDSLGKAEIWYVMDAKPGAKMYCGFNREVSAQEFYDRCHAGTVDEVLNVIEPRKGDVIFITPGTVHAADGGLLIAEIQESSDMTFRLYDWGREFNPATARKTHLDEAIDVIDYRPFDFGLYRKGPLWGDEASYVACHSHEEGHECHCHEESQEGQMIQNLVECPQFSVSKIALTDPLHIYTDKFESFIVYICLEGAASIQVPSVRENGEAYMENYEFSKGETILVPADMPDFFLVPRDRSTLLLEGVTRPVEEQDSYIDPETEAFLEGEDYEGIEDETDDEPKGPAGASPLNFFN